MESVVETLEGSFGAIARMSAKEIGIAGVVVVIHNHVVFVPSVKHGDFLVWGDDQTLL